MDSYTNSCISNKYGQLS